MLIVYYGSCQTAAIAKIIRLNLTKCGIPFTDCIIQNWVHILNKTTLPKEIYDCDYLIYQPYNGSDENVEYHTDKVLKKISYKTKTISIPFISSAMYWPDNVSDARNNKTKTDKLPFGKFPQQSCILSRCRSVDEMHNNLYKEHYDKFYLNNHLKRDLAKMTSGEELCDVKICDYIEAHLANSVPLFHSIQHPTNDILLEVAKRVLKHFNIELSEIPSEELLGDHTVLILPYVKIFYNTVRSTYKLYGREYVSEKTYLDEYFNSINSQEIGFDFWAKPVIPAK